MDLQEKQLAAVLLVDTSKAVHGQQRSTGHENLPEKQLLLSEARTRAAGGGEVNRGGAVVDAGAEVLMLFWLKLAC